jgi:hypothetical protein
MRADPRAQNATELQFEDRELHPFERASKASSSRSQERRLPHPTSAAVGFRAASLAVTDSSRRAAVRCEQGPWHQLRSGAPSGVWCAAPVCSSFTAREYRSRQRPSSLVPKFGARNGGAHESVLRPCLGDTRWGIGSGEQATAREASGNLAVQFERPAVVPSCAVTHGACPPQCDIGTLDSGPGFSSDLVQPASNSTSVASMPSDTGLPFGRDSGA